MAYYKDNGYKSSRNFYHNISPIRKSWYTVTNLNNLFSTNEANRCCRKRCKKSYCSPPSCGCCKCNCCCCCKEEKPESHKFIDYADASISSSNLPDQKQKCPFICGKTDVSVQTDEVCCDCQKFGTMLVSPDCLKVESNVEHDLNMDNSFPINQQVLATCIKRTEICNSVCPAAHCFNFEKQIQLNPCEKNVNINVEVKVKKKKKKDENGYREKCKCKRQLDELMLLKPCVCFNDPSEDQDTLNNSKCEMPKTCLIPCPNIKEKQKKCTSEKPKPLTFCAAAKQKPVNICCPPCADKSKMFDILSQFCKSIDSKTEDVNNQNTNENIFVCKPISPNDFSSMMKGLKNCHNRKNSVSPSECVKMFKKKLEKQRTEKCKTSTNGLDTINSDITLEMLKKKPSSKYSSQHSQRKLSSR